MSSFPNSIRQFTTKRDGVDVNYAAHINDLQDELVGVENTLGILPTFDANVGPKGTTYPTVKDRLNALSAGKSRSAFSVGSSILYRVPADSQWHTPTFGAPPSNQDPDGLWNGTGFTLKTSGLWYITYYVHFDPNSAPGTKMASMARGTAISTYGALAANSTPNEPFTEGLGGVSYYAAGTAISLVANNQTAAVQTMRYYSLSGFMVRGV